jgi:hypothetical protein
VCTFTFTQTCDPEKNPLPSDEVKDCGKCDPGYHKEPGGGCITCEKKKNKKKIKNN